MFVKGAGISRAESHTGTLPAVRYGELYTEHNDYVRSYCSFISEEVASHSYKTKRGDILFTCSGETAEDIGKAVAVLDDGVYAGGDLLVFSLKEEGDPIFWGTLLNTPPVQIQKSNFSHGATIIHIGESDLSKVEVQFPPLPVQRRIASSLSAVDGHLASLGELVSKYEAIKKSTVSLLLRPQQTWQKVRLGDVAKVFRGGSPRPIQDYITSDANGINWIKIGDVATDAKYIEHTEEKIKPSGIAMSRQVKAGDFILSNSMSFGRPYILKIDGCIHDGWLTIQDYQATFEADYLYYLLGSEYVFAQYLEHAAGSSVKNLNKEAVGNLSLPVPPLSEQRRIVTALSSLDGVLASLAAEREKLASLKRGLLRHFFG